MFKIGVSALLVACIGAFLFFAVTDFLRNDSERKFLTARIALVDSLEGDTSKTFALLCDAENAGLTLVRENPFDPSVLIQYAAVSARLRGYDCQRMNFASEREPGFREVVDFALARAPNNKGLLLAAAMIERRIAGTTSDEIRRGAFLRRALQAPGDFTSDQLRALRDELDSEEILKAAMPPVPERVALVSELLRERGAPAFAPFPDPGVRAALEALQGDVLKRLGATLDFSMLKRLGTSAASAELRATADRMMSEQMTAESGAGIKQILARRAELRMVPVVPGIIYDDRRPERGALLRWRIDEPFALDKVGRSLGVAIPDGKRASAVQLTSSAPNAALDGEEVSVWGSSDNRSFSQITVNRATPAFFDSQTILFLDIAGRAGDKFVKVKFTAPIHRERFSGVSGTMIEVFSEP